MQNSNDVFLDLTGVEENSFEMVPPGEHPVIMLEAEVKKTRSGSGEYIAATFQVVHGPAENRKLFHNFNIKNDNPKAAEIGLGQLKSFMRCSEIKDDKLRSVVELTAGKPVVAVVKHKQDEQYGPSAVVSYFKPWSGGAAAVAKTAGQPF